MSEEESWFDRGLFLFGQGFLILVGVLLVVGFILLLLSANIENDTNTLYEMNESQRNQVGMEKFREYWSEREQVLAEQQYVNISYSCNELKQMIELEVYPRVEKVLNSEIVLNELWVLASEHGFYEKLEIEEMWFSDQEFKDYYLENCILNSTEVKVE